MATMTMTKRERGAKSMDGGEAWVRQLPNAQHITSVIALGTIILCDWNILLMTANVCLGSSLQRFSWLLLLSETWIAFLKSQKMSNSLFSEDLSSKTIESINHMIIMFYSISHKNTHFLSVNIFALRWDYYLDTQQIFWHQSHFNYLVSS